MLRAKSGSAVFVTEKNEAVVTPTGFSHGRLTVTDDHTAKKF